MLRVGASGRAFAARTYDYVPRFSDTGRDW